jgi:hypothetical protein
MTKSKANMKKVWYYSYLLELQDSVELNKKNIIKKSYESFLHIKRDLPNEIKDFLTVKSDHVCINEKYIK